MNPLILAVRAISVEFAKRLIIPIFVIGLVIITIFIGLTIWLMTMSGWWTILLVAFIIGALIFIATSIVAYSLLNAVEPQQTASQKKRVKKFVDTLQEISDTVQTPKIFLLARIVWDTVRKNDNGLVRTMSSHTAATKDDFEAIRKSFD